MTTTDTAADTAVNAVPDADSAAVSQPLLQPDAPVGGGTLWSAIIEAILWGIRRAADALRVSDDSDDRVVFPERAGTVRADA